MRTCCYGIAGQSERLPATVRTALAEPGHECFFSAASIWEVVIKGTLGRADFQVNAAPLRSGLLANGYSELAIMGRHVLAVRDLPAIHKDPFDRILVAQALVETATLLTCDPVLAAYPGSIRHV